MFQVILTIIMYHFNGIVFRWTTIIFWIYRIFIDFNVSKTLEDLGLPYALVIPALLMVLPEIPVDIEADVLGPVIEAKSHLFFWITCKQLID